MRNSKKNKKSLEINATHESRLQAIYKRLQVSLDRQALLLFIALYYLVLIVVVAAVSSFSGLASSSAMLLVSQGSILLASIITTVLIFGGKIDRYRESLSNIVSKASISLKLIVKWSSIALVLLLVNMSIIAAVSPGSEGGDVLAEMSILMRFISTVIIAPLVEEISFRVLPYTQLKVKSKTNIMYIVATSLVFASLHISVNANIWATFVTVSSVFIVGATCAYLYQKNENFIEVVSIHAIYNLLIFILTMSL